MAGEKDPIKLSPEMAARIPELETLIQDFEFELSRRKRAGFDVTEDETRLGTMKTQLAGIKREYLPL